MGGNAAGKVEAASGRRAAPWPRAGRARRFAAVVRECARFAACHAAAVGAMTALLMVPIAGAIALALESGTWYYFQRNMQNAADSAAIAAASNNSANVDTGGSTYLAEARAAARPFGFVDGQNHTSVTATPVDCPAAVLAATPSAKCYQATLSTIVPLSLSYVVGFTGDAAYGTGRGQTVVASAIATTSGGGTTTNVCVFTLSPNPNSFTSNGGPKPDMAGCALMSNGGMTCNGHDLGADVGVAVGTNNGCGIMQPPPPPIPTQPDPYAAKASNIPADPCGTNYPQIPTNASGKLGNLTNKTGGGFLDQASYSGTGGYLKICGDAQLKNNVTLAAGTTLVIYNGRLDLAGYTLSGTSSTVIFSGTNDAAYSHYPASSVNNAGTLDIKAPETGTWQGMAIYQDPAVTTNVNFTYTGNAPTWNITGVTYFPKADVTFGGVVNKSATGSNCFVLVAYSVLVNGTAQILADTGCASSGVPPLTYTGTGTREKLVR